MSGPGSELWLASSNEKKRAELERLLAGRRWVLRLQSEAPRAVAVDEDQPDFAGNAAKKAVALATAVSAPAVGDDSGLCVDALGGRPGVHSARYGGPGASDADRIARLLDELRAVPAAQRGARFVCHLCLAAADGEVLARFEETCAGSIAMAPRGSAGFGYDPIFVPAPHGPLDTARTFAELSPAEKDAVSHRGKALRRLVAFLERHPLR